MATWGDLKEQRPDLTAAGRELLYTFGVGLAFLATVRKDGGPRLHPMCPTLLPDEAQLYGLLIPSPKRDDLVRDGRYALHSYPSDANEDAFYVTGRSVEVGDAGEAAAVLAQFTAERPGMDLVEDQGVFRFDIERCLVTRTTGHGDPAPRHEVWRATASR
jgi:hypothetical protein